MAESSLTNGIDPGGVRGRSCGDDVASGVELGSHC